MSENRTGLYFGSFNPLHIGHIAVARYFSECGELNELRLIVSPQNPLKESSPESDAVKRLEAVRIALHSHKINATVSDVEFYLPKPLYTIYTLRYLRTMEPEREFILITGADIMAEITLWHEYKNLLNEFPIWVYPRKGFDGEALCKKYGTRYIDAPMIDISSTQIRDGEQNGLDMSSFKA